MNYRYIYLLHEYPFSGFGKDFDDKFRYNTWILCNYLSRHVRKLHLPTDGEYNLLSCCITKEKDRVRIIPEKCLCVSLHVSEEEIKKVVHYTISHQKVQFDSNFMNLDNVDYEKIFSLMAGCCFGVGLVQAIVYPLIFKYGIEKGRIGLFIGVFVMVSVIGLLSKEINIDISSNILVFIENYWLIFIPIVLIITLFISYKISLKIYLKKEF